LKRDHSHIIGINAVSFTILLLCKIAQVLCAKVVYPEIDQSDVHIL